jgi:putative spermidine/putrescine transport system substrate-binding protein
MNRSKFTVPLLVVLALSSVTKLSQAEEKTLSIGTWGGFYEKAQQQALFMPFTQKTGIKITTVPYNGGIEILKQNDVPDLVSMDEADALIACNEGLLISRDYRGMVAPAPNGGAIDKDFLPQTFSPCSVAQVTFSTVIAYNLEAFPQTKPQTISDFFDLDRFPGKRGLHKNPNAILEWALMARGVPNNQVYDLLSTQRGLRLALEKLNTIRQEIVWWDTPDEPAEMLMRGDIVMTSGYNGRIFAAQAQQAPVIILWDGQLIEFETWVITGKQDKQNPHAREFIRFATTAEAQARLTEYIPYGPTRRGAYERLGKHSEHNFHMADHLPTATHHLAGALFKDSEWLANTASLRQRAFDAWLAE